MEFRCIPDDLSTVLTSWQGDSLAVGLFTRGESNPQEPLHQLLESVVGPGFSDRLQQRRFKAKPGEVVTIDRLGATPQPVAPGRKSWRWPSPWLDYPKPPLPKPWRGRSR